MSSAEKRNRPVVDGVCGFKAQLKRPAYLFLLFLAGYSAESFEVSVPTKLKLIVVLCHHPPSSCEKR